MTEKKKKRRGWIIILLLLIILAAGGYYIYNRFFGGELPLPPIFTKKAEIVFTDDRKEFLFEQQEGQWNAMDTVDIQEGTEVMGPSRQ